MRAALASMLGTAALLASGVATAEQRLEGFDVLFWGSLSGPSPVGIIQSDNNDQILLACRSPLSRDALRSKGVGFVESQIQLLKVMGLLVEAHGALATNFPILGASDAEQLRERTGVAAAVLAERIAPRVRELNRVLLSRGQGESAYAVLFSYVLDGLVWTRLSELGALSATEADKRNPFWSGEVWAIEPKRSFSVGTNSDGYRGSSFHLLWSHALAPLLGRLLSDAPVHQLLQAHVRGGRLADSDALAVFSRYGIVDAGGRLNVPVIRKSDDDELNRLCQTLSREVADQALGLLDLDRLAKQCRLRDKGQALVIAYHELEWDTLVVLERRRLVQEPAALANPATAQPKDVHDLAFIVEDVPRSK